MCEKTTNGRTLLIVDDDKDLVRGMKLRFASAGYKILVAESAASGIQAAITQRPAAIVMDIHMEGGCGLDAIEQLKLHSETADIPVIVLSACIGKQQQALDRGAQFFLRKPYKATDMLTAVASVVKKTTYKTTHPKETCS